MINTDEPIVIGYAYSAQKIVYVVAKLKLVDIFWDGAGTLIAYRLTCIDRWTPMSEDEISSYNDEKIETVRNAQWLQDRIYSSKCHAHDDDRSPEVYKFIGYLSI